MGSIAVLMQARAGGSLLCRRQVCNTAGSAWPPLDTGGGQSVPGVPPLNGGRHQGPSAEISSGDTRSPGVLVSKGRGLDLVSRSPSVTAPYEAGPQRQPAVVCAGSCIVGWPTPTPRKVACSGAQFEIFGIGGQYDED